MTKKRLIVIACVLLGLAAAPFVLWGVTGFLVGHSRVKALARKPPEWVIDQFLASNTGPLVRNADSAVCFEYQEADLSISQYEIAMVDDGKRKLLVILKDRAPIAAALSVENSLNERQVAWLKMDRVQMLEFIENTRNKE